MVSESKMREILFRGKRICEKKNWVEGCLLNLDADSGHVFIVPFFNGASTMPVSRIVECTSNYVNPETVGQFTGLTDKNGKKIFEGDVVEVNHDAYPGVRGKVFFKNGSFMLKNVSDVLTLYGFLPWCEVIGNIHDNPELLEVSHV